MLDSRRSHAPCEAASESEPARADEGPTLRDKASLILAEALEGEQERQAQVAKPLRATRPFSIAVGIGVFLIFCEVVSLSVLYYRTSRGPLTPNPRPNPLSQRNDCRGEAYRTYRKIVGYMQDNVGKPPASLAELVPRYSVIVPSDPLTGRPLTYSKEGARLVIGCK